MKKVLSRYLESRPHNTRRRYEYVLRQYLDFLKKKFGGRGYGNLRKANTTDAYRYFDFIKSRQGIVSREDPSDTKAANRTVNNTIKALRNIYDVLISEKCLSFNPFKTRLISLLPETARPKRPTEVIPLWAIKSILKPGKRARKQDQLRTLCATMLAGGLRISEALALKIGDIRTDPEGLPYTILNDTKGGGRLEHTIGKWALPLITKHISKRSAEGAKNEDFLFVGYSKGGKVRTAKYSVTTAARHIKAVLRALKLPNCSAHSFRKTAIDRLVQQGEHIEKIRQFARHADVRITQDYFAQFNHRDSAANKISW